MTSSFEVKNSANLSCLLEFFFDCKLYSLDLSDGILNGLEICSGSVTGFELAKQCFLTVSLSLSNSSSDELLEGVLLPFPLDAPS